MIKLYLAGIAVAVGSAFAFTPRTMTIEHSITPHALYIDQNSAPDLDYVWEVDQFDPALGTLLSVRVGMFSIEHRDVGKKEWLENQDLSVYWKYNNTTASKAITTIRTGGSEIWRAETFGPLLTYSTLFTAYDGVTDYAGTSGGTLNSNVMNYSLPGSWGPTDLTPWIGTGTKRVTIRPLGLSEGSRYGSHTPGSGSNSESLSVRVNPYVIYEYTP